MSFTIIKNFQVPGNEFHKVEKQLHCSAQRFLVKQEINYVVKSCEQFVSDYWFVKSYGQECIVGFLSVQDTVAFKLMFPDCKPHHEQSKHFVVSDWNNPLLEFPIKFLEKLAGYAEKRPDKTVKFQNNIYRLNDIRDAIFEKNIRLNKKFPEFDKISTKRLLKLYKTRRSNILIHGVGSFPREYIKQVLDTREHI